MLRHYERQFRGLRDADPLSVAATLHRLVDNHLERAVETSEHAPSVKCRRGCDACCHLLTSIGDFEGRLALAYADEQGVEIDVDRLHRQAGHSIESWRTLPKSDRRCVFLGDEGECRIYAHRPASCRKLLVITDPAFCDTDLHPGHQVGRLFSIEAEAIDSAAMTAFAATPEPMANVLLRVLEARPISSSRPTISPG